MNSPIIPTIVESFFNGWHIQARKVRRSDHFESVTECGDTYVPQDVVHTSDLTGVCRECRRLWMIRTGDTSYVSLKSIDVGFDLRLHDIDVVLPDEDDITIETDHGIYAGPRAEVIREMRRDGWKISDRQA